MPGRITELFCRRIKVSIIYEALKKVEEIQDFAHREIRIEKPGKTKYAIFLLYLGVAVLGFLLTNMLWEVLSRQVNKTRVTSVPLMVAKEVSIPVENKSATLKSELKPLEPTPLLPSSLLLNGIFFSEDEGYALINNQIVKVGDSVEGAIVKQILADSVELEEQGRLIRLSTNR